MRFNNNETNKSKIEDNNLKDHIVKFELDFRQKVKNYKVFESIEGEKFIEYLNEGYPNARPIFEQKDTQ